MNTQVERQEKKLILAMDPFDPGSEPCAGAVAGLNGWASEQGLLIQPVYIASPSTADISLGYVAPVAELEKKLDAHARKLGFSVQAPARVLVHDSASREASVKAFLEFAAKEGAAAIALTSHGRSGVDRFILGSFAETLLRDSPWPVYFLTHTEAKRGPGPACVFFATDFSPSSRRVFERFLTGFRPGSRKLTIFHSINFPTPYAPVGTAYVPESYFEDQERWSQASAKEWVALAREKGADAEAVIRNGGMDILTGREILEEASGCGTELIVMASSSGALERALFGSVAFEIFRSRQLPVLVYGPRALKNGGR